MATFAFIDGTITVNAVNMSPMITSVSLKIQADELEDTAFGDTYRSRLGGLKDWSVDIDFNQDFAASQVDQTLFPLLGTVITVTVKATSAANSATNPQYSGSVLVKEYTPLDGGVGDLAKTSVSWPGAGTLTRLIV
jgi:hypothetical protein